MTDDGAERKAQTQAIFNRLAADYDVAGPGCFVWYGRRLVEEAGVRSGDRVLDVATGRGAVLVPAAERVGPGGSVTGIDLSEEMVRIASAEAARLGGNVQVQQMDAERLDFPNAAFDHVLCGFGIMFFPNLDRALGEFQRVLKPGGRVAVSTWQISQAHDLGVVLNALDLGRLDEPGWISDPAQLTNVLARAGFTDLHVHPDAHVFHYDGIDQYWQNARGTGLRRWLDTLDPQQTEQVRAAFAQRVQSQTQPDGLHLSATALLATGRLPQHEAA